MRSDMFFVSRETWTNPYAWFEIQSCLQDSKIQVIVNIFNMTDCLTNYCAVTLWLFLLYQFDKP